LAAWLLVPVLLALPELLVPQVLRALVQVVLQALYQVAVA